jgi:indolepyruvate ferredoxin oxidoreductase alpha subunit
MSGNEAIARGAYEAGARLLAGYPGTPSTEIIEAAAAYREMYSEWSPNEKVAMEVAIGACLGGAWAMVTMKHVGLNVAADPLMSVSYMHLEGALVVVTADDPGMWSSQNEQDNRVFARFAKIPMFEPSDSQEAKDMTILAFQLSHQFHAPVLVRTTTKLSHTRCPVKMGERADVPQGPGPGGKIVLKPELTVMIPANARMRHPVVEQRLLDLRRVTEGSPLNLIDNPAADGPAFVTSGVPYTYVREAFPHAPVLKLGMSYPVPVETVRGFVASHKETYVIEELDPLVETELRAEGIAVKGKDLLTRVGEYNAPMLLRAIAGDQTPEPEGATGLPPRPPQLCAGCPHRGVFYVLAGKKAMPLGDIGCYTLAVTKPLEAVYSCTCMGASIGHAHGMEKALGKDITKNIVAVIGDSTFFHSGITPLLNVVYNKGVSKVIIVDNRTTAMTGHQGNPGTGLDARGEKAPEVDLVALVKALGIADVTVIDPYDLQATKAAIDRVMSKEEPAVIISRRECALLRTAERRPPVQALADGCRACGLCFKLGCPALYKVAGKTTVDAGLCNGCSMCVQVCPFGALKEVATA